MQDKGRLQAALPFSGGVRGSVPWDPPAPLSQPSPREALPPPSKLEVTPADTEARERAAALRQLEEEEAELWRQLRRKGEFEARLADKQSQLADARERRRTVAKEHAEAVVAVRHLADQVEFSRQQEKEAEHDIAILRESNRILQTSFQAKAQSQKKMPAKPQSEDWFAEERGQREKVRLQQEQIAHLRAHLERLSQNKVSLQLRQQDLFAKQRGAEQDRNRLLGALQDDRSAINDVRAERIRLWDERAALDQEAALLVREIHLQARGADAGAAIADAVLPPSVPHGLPGASGGVRGAVPLDDTSALFADQGPVPVVVDTSTPLWAQEPPRPQHWTTFGVADDDAGQEPAGTSTWTTFGNSGAGEGLPGDTGLAPGPLPSGASLPPSFGAAQAVPTKGGLLGGSGHGELADCGTAFGDLTVSVEREETARERVARRVRESARAEVMRVEQAEREREAATRAASAAGSGVTEWAGRLRDFNVAGADPSF